MAEKRSITRKGSAGSKRTVTRTSSRTRGGRKDSPDADKASTGSFFTKKRIIIGVLAIVLLPIIGVLSWAGLLYSSTGDTYAGELDAMIPAESVLVADLGPVGQKLDRVQSRIEELFARRQSWLRLESSPLWASMTEDKNGQPFSMQDLLYKKLQPGLSLVRQQLSSLPISVTLEEDLAGKDVRAALVNMDGKLQSLLLTRITEPIQFGWNFTSFATGTYDKTVVGTDGDFLTVKNPSTEVWVGLFDDVLVVATSDVLAKQVQALHGGKGNTLRDLDSYQRAMLRSQALASSYDMRAWANLDAVRTMQGPDPEDPQRRSKIDQYFAISNQVRALSPEIMPSVDAVLSHAIDTRAFTSVLWHMSLGEGDRMHVDQVLVSDEARVAANHSQLLPSWRMLPASMPMLRYLPEQTWMVLSNRLPLGVVRDAVKPPLDNEGKPKPSAVYSFLKSLGEGSEVDEIGMALLGKQFAIDPRQHSGLVPPGLVTNVPFPPFALFLHWPGVTHERATALMAENLRDLGAQNLIMREVNDSYGQYVVFDNPNNVNLIQWLTQFSCAAVGGEYLVFSYSLNHQGLQQILSLSKAPKTAKAEGSLFAQKGAPFSSLPAEQSALVYFDPAGMQDFNQMCELSQVLADAKYPINFPNGKSLVELREELSRAMGPNNAGIDAEMNRIKDSWVAMRAPYQNQLERSFHALGALESFVAQTQTATTHMHTRFQFTLAK